MLNHYSSEKCKPKPHTCQEGYHPKKPEVYNKVQLVLVRIWGNWDPYILLGKQNSPVMVENRKRFPKNVKIELPYYLGFFKLKFF